MFRFWYKFIPQALPLIQRGFTDDAYKEIEPQISGFMGKVFEEICKQYLWKERGQNSAAIDFIDVGRWWGNDPINKCEAEIDILAYKDKKSAIFGECKWTNEKVDLKVLEDLIQKSKLFRYENNYFYIFAKSGFTRACEDKSKENKNIKLVTFEEMVK